MRARGFSPVFVLVVAAAAMPATAEAAPPAPSAAVTIERIVAVVGREVIVLSELRARKRPYLAEIARTIPNDAAKRAAAERELEKELLGRMIDELLIAAEATRLRVAVSASEVDAMLLELASRQGLSVPDLLSEARKTGMSEQEYRAEVRRQMLALKLVPIVLKPRIKGFAALSEADREARVADEQRKWIGELRAKSFIEVRL